jgi:hypothetical protein
MCARTSPAQGDSRQSLDGPQAVIPDVEAVLVHVQRDVCGAHVVGQLLRVGTDVCAAGVRVVEGVADVLPDRRLRGGDDRVVQAGARADRGPASDSPGR